MADTLRPLVTGLVGNMAGGTLTAEEALLAKRVQELAADGHEPPSRYIRKDKDDGAVTAVDASQSSSIPIIDLQLLTSSSNKERGEEMNKLRDALSSWGVFQVVGHGMPATFLDEVRQIGLGFFNLPMEEKRKYARVSEGGSIRLDAYGSDHVASEDQVLDWSDRLDLLVFPQSERELNLWPKHPDSFRELLDEYSLKSKLVAVNLVKAMAECVGLEENDFLSQFGEWGPIYARFNYYPPCSRPDLVYGIKPHADGDGLTILLQDREVEGLQILKDGQWLKVPTIPHALVINVGDQMEIMSNGMFKSLVHRVITNAEKERISLATFYGPEVDKEIGPPAGLIDKNRPRVYRNVKVKDYVDVYFPKYLEGKSALDWAKA